MKTHSEVVQVRHDSVHGRADLHLYQICPEICEKPLPAVLIFPTWAGQDLFVQHKANLMVQQGYIGVAADLYGNARQGEGIEECSALMGPFMKNRTFLKERIQTIIDHLKKDPRIDSQNIVATGYCFGGLCALDAARNNMGLKGAVSIHGLFHKPDYKLPEKYTAKILALYGFQDPMVTREECQSFEQELHGACEDWQLIAFGQGKHAFTNPDAFDEARGLVYNALLDKRTTKYVTNFLQELLGKG